MTDIREKVARAILETDPTCDYDGCKKRVESGVLGPSDRDWWENTLHAQADNAIRACGYAEMRKAMEALIECHGDPEAIAAARSILERTGEK